MIFSNCRGGGSTFHGSTRQVEIVRRIDRRRTGGNSPDRAVNHILGALGPKPTVLVVPPVAAQTMNTARIGDDRPDGW
jgi:hypothetical protein